jgi:hypothetical protein
MAAVIDLFPSGSFEAAVENLNPGDTLIVHAGTYQDSGRISISVQGTPSLPVVIQGAAGEARPLITRPGSAAVQNTINIEGATHLTVKGLEITGNGGDGINMSGGPSFITLEDLDIHDVDVGVNFRSSMDHITVRRCHIHRTGIGGGTGEGMYVGCNNATCIVRDSVLENNWIHDALPGTTQGDGIEIKVGSHSNLIRDNVIYNMSYPGVLAYGTGANPVNVIEGNVVWNCLEGISALSDAVVRNNIVIQSGSGVGSYNHVQVSGRKNVTIVHNTLYDNDAGLYFQGTVNGLVVANNAVYSPGGTAVSGAPGGTYQSNYVAGSVSGGIDGTKFISAGSASTAFVNPTGRDFWPQVGSPLIGTAQAAQAPPFDFNHRSRTVPHDVGAYAVLGASANRGWSIQENFKSVSGTPVDTTPPAPPEGLTVR